MQHPQEEFNTGPTSPQEEPGGDESWWAAEHPDAGPPAGPPGEGPAALAGGTCSVTRPSQNSSGEVQVLLAGIDTLDFGIFVEFGASWPKMVTRLKQLKNAARTKDVVLGGGRCQVAAGGKPNYPFLLQYPGFQLYLSRKARPDGQTPNLYISLKAETLWHLGEQAAIDLVLAELQDLAPGAVRECRMSRCDLAVDLQIAGGLDDRLLRDHAVSQSDQYQFMLKKNRLETFYVGAKDSPIQLRIYDKSVETIKKEKFWFLPLWGLELNVDVWRVEFQLRRPFLKSCGIDSLEQLLQARGVLWSYLTGTWFSLRAEDNAHVSRRSILQFWEVVQGAFSSLETDAEPLRRQSPKPSPDPSRVIQQAASLLVGYGARRQLTDLGTAAHEFLQALQETLSENEFQIACQRKAIQLGVDLPREAA